MTQWDRVRSHALPQTGGLDTPLRATRITADTAHMLLQALQPANTCLWSVRARYATPEAIFAALEPIASAALHQKTLIG